MNALFFIILRSVKNWLKETVRKPGKLALYLIIIALLFFVVIVNFSNNDSQESPAPLFILTGILFLFISIFYVIAVSKGLSSGETIFEMNDVNLLFVSPVNSRKILIYGIVRMTKTAFLAGFFILFQSTLLSVFGFGYSGVLLTFAGFILSLVVLTIISLLIYSTTNGKPLYKNIVKLIAASFYAPLAVFIITQYFNTYDITASIEAAVKSPFFSFIPVIGWTSAGITSFLSGDTASGFLFFGLNIFLGAGLITYIMLSNPDYYEDVLVATETTFEKQRALTEGNITAVNMTDRKVRVSKTGITGKGAASLFFKHIRESFRENRFGFLSWSSLLLIAGAALASYFLRDLIIIGQTLMWVQIMMIGTGRGLKETYIHYIYMIPEPSFKKIIWSNMEIMTKSLIESALIFTISGIVIKEDPVFILVCVITYAIYSFLLLGVNYVFMRLTGADISYGFLIMFYFLAVLLVMAPGIVMAVITGIAIEGKTGLILGVSVLAVWELLAGLGCFALSRGVLHSCDIAVFKKGK